MLFSVGHGRLDREAFTALLAGAGVESLVDIRRYPGSRRNPDVNTDAMAKWLPAAGIAYRTDDRLGGRRRLPADVPNEDPWWQVEQFAAYAAHTRTAEFGTALTELLDQSAQTTTAMMCSESVWWRCHRRLVADVAVMQRGESVEHLMHDGRARRTCPLPGHDCGPTARSCGIWRLTADARGPGIGYARAQDSTRCSQDSRV